jgi:hypothetical protein
MLDKWPRNAKHFVVTSGAASTPCAANLAAPRRIEWISDIEETRAAADLCDSCSGKVAGSGIKRRGAADLE